VLDAIYLSLDGFYGTDLFLNLISRLIVKRLTNNSTAIKLGDLSGNRFKIVIRELSEQNDQIINEAVESLKENGFINYFGLQRFGNCSQIPTHHIGKLALDFFSLNFL
jgi:TruD family tRNA pseudouridine synthase